MTDPKKKSASKPKVPNEDLVEDENEKPGFPDRDFRKNLGCG